MSLPREFEPVLTPMWSPDVAGRLIVLSAQVSDMVRRNRGWLQRMLPGVWGNYATPELAKKRIAHNAQSANAGWLFMIMAGEGSGFPIGFASAIQGAIPRRIDGISESSIKGTQLDFWLDRDALEDEETPGIASTEVGVAQQLIIRANTLGRPNPFAELYTKDGGEVDFDDPSAAFSEVMYPTGIYIEPGSHSLDNPADYSGILESRRRIYTGSMALAVALANN